MNDTSTMTNEVKKVAQVLDDCAALLGEYSNAFPQAATDSAAVAFADKVLSQARDHSLRTIRGMIRLLRDDEGNIALACTLLRSFYELSVRLLWASRAVDGWRRLELYFANEIRNWARGCKDSPSPRLAALGTGLLQKHQAEEATKWRDASGSPIRPAPRKIEDVLKEIEGHDAPQDHSIGKHSGQIIYTVFYRVICRPAHVHVEPLTGRFDTMYLKIAGYGTCLAGAALLAALIHHTSQSPVTDVGKMHVRFGPLLRGLAFGDD